MSEEVINDGPDADEIAEMVIECVRKNCYGMIAFKVAEIGRGTNFWSDLNFDILDMTELIIDLEDKLSSQPPYYSVSIPEEVGEKVETVGDLIDEVFNVMGIEE